eukprot:Plantae.Rhodophyta-Hildenbrandia_rubra.ctg10991.p1 GENE.Plantae.Rhodophyta-Hildenbrandia_rubra.ctg10991~~Plantae.Rhodophyta-Hildenbrandia_rubra.ctg10991.p1  ORF type:complete len:494 (-),score=91.70 Plantae.Rhodophyta-Hildenbrandia_rubra.ctg10991:193-1674(-)
MVRSEGRGSSSSVRQRKRRNGGEKRNGHAVSTRPSSSTNGTRNGEQGRVVRSKEEVARAEYISLFRAIAAAVAVIGVFIYSAMTTTLPPENRVYGAMIDAGSTGTRGQVFEFEWNGAGGPLKLVRSRAVEVEKGMAVIAEGVEGKQYFGPLIKQLQSFVPGKKRRSVTPIFLRATAGLRLTEGQKVNHVLEEARKALKTSGFLFEKDEWVSILDDDQEAVYGWISTNYLLGKFGRNATEKAKGSPVGILDLGGGSMQIAFRHPGKDVSASEKQDWLAKKVKVLSEHHDVVSKGYLGYGLFDFTRKLYEHLDQAGKLQGPNICFRKGRTLTNKNLRLGVAGSERTKVLDIHGNGDFGACVSAVEHVLQSNGGILDEALLTASSSVEFYAFAYFYSRVQRFGLGETVTVKQLQDKGRQLCEDEADVWHPGEVDESCAEFSYVYTLIKKVTRNFNKAERVKFIQYVDGHMLGWSLGALLNEMEPLLKYQLAMMRSS